MESNINRNRLALQRSDTLDVPIETYEPIGFNAR